MAVRTRIKNSSQILKALRSKWEAAGFTNFQDKDAKLRAMTQPFIEELRIFSEDTQQAFNDLQVGSAIKTALDSLGKTRGQPRQESKFAQVSSTESSLAFFVTSGVFGDINGGNQIIVPAGTTIWSNSNENDQNEVVTYKLDVAATLPADQSIVFVSATAATDGPIGNVGAQVLRNHDFTNYASSAGKGLKIVNFFPILNGTSTESDERYRGRLLSYYRSLQASNYDALLINGLSVPGVRTTTLSRGYFGIGTSALFVNGPEGRSNNRMVAAVQQAIRASTPPGGDLQAIPMVEVTVDMSVKVKAVNVLTAARQEQIEALLRSILLGYLRDVLQSNYIEFSEYQRRASLQLAAQGVSIPRDGFFNRIYVGRSYGGGSVDERNLLNGTSVALQSFEYPALGEFTVVFE